MQVLLAGRSSTLWIKRGHVIIEVRRVCFRGSKDFIDYEAAHHSVHKEQSPQSVNNLHKPAMAAESCPHSTHER